MCEIHATSLAPPLAKVQSFFNPAFARRNHPPPDESAVRVQVRDPGKREIRVSGVGFGIIRPGRKYAKLDDFSLVKRLFGYFVNLLNI
jgi:hypothetical protein